jgi:hypothetical protein
MRIVLIRGKCRLNPEQSAILTDFILFRQKPEEIHAKLLQVSNGPQRFHFLHPVNDIQVLTPMNKVRTGEHDHH